MIETLQHLPIGDLAGLSAVTLFAALFLATFVSEDAACIAAGALVASGEISLGLAIASCFLGIVAGDLGLYWIGRTAGRKIFRMRFARRFVSPRSLERASAWLERRGASAVFASRFITGLRLPTYLAAGLLGTSFWKFAFYFVLAAAIWTPLLVGSIALTGGVFDHVLVTAIGGFVAIRIAIKLATWRRRRIALGKLKRLVQWEFWPLWIFYLPVVCYVIVLAVRYRSLTVFTCANPGIPHGGFVGESKNSIYSLINASAANRDLLPRHRLLDAGLSVDEKLAVAAEFMTENALSFPVVIKPDSGERGRGVRVVGSQGELEDAIKGKRRPLILQEFVDGREMSVFYYRYPGRDRGSIFSMTEKVFASVTGDGSSTLEELILSDRRAVCLAEKYLEENVDQLGLVPAKDTRVPIIQIGTHSRGAIFLDGGHLKTAQLESAIDDLCRRIEGFNFGRFDIRYSSVEELRLGTGFKIIELNGVTSESTNIYDPRYSLFDAYRILFRQWRIAFEIGRANKRRGVEVTRPAEIFRTCLRELLLERRFDHAPRET